MVGYFALGSFCMLIGFGLGRLRLHAVIRSARQSRKPRGGRSHTVMLDQVTAVEVWKQTFAESFQVARDFFKWLIGVGTVGLTATVALLTVKGNVPQLKMAAFAFAVSLIVTAMPTARMTNRLNNKAQKLGSRISRTSQGRLIPVSLPYVWSPGKQTWVEFIAILMLGIAILVFLKALSHLN